MNTTAAARTDVIELKPIFLEDSLNRWWVCRCSMGLPRGWRCGRRPTTGIDPF
jgi:hypothetical protein